MSNEIRFRTLVTPVQDTEVVEGGATYNNYNIQNNAGRGFGGKYEGLSFQTGSVKAWTNATLATSTYDGLDNNDCFGNSVTTTGAIPDRVRGFAIEYDNELSTGGLVHVRLWPKGAATLDIASLDKGEGIAMPVVGGISPASIMLKSGSYTKGTYEARINALLIGTKA